MQNFNKNWSTLSNVTRKCYATLPNLQTRFFRDQNCWQVHPVKHAQSYTIRLNQSAGNFNKRGAIMKFYYHDPQSSVIGFIVLVTFTVLIPLYPSLSKNQEENIKANGKVCTTYLGWLGFNAIFQVYWSWWLYKSQNKPSNVLSGSAITTMLPEYRHPTGCTHFTTKENDMGGGVCRGWHRTGPFLPPCFKVVVVHRRQETSLATLWLPVGDPMVKCNKNQFLGFLQCFVGNSRLNYVHHRNDLCNP